jgi:hypothetical protein
MEASPGFHLGIWDYATFVAIFIVVVAGLAAQVAGTLVVIGAAVAGACISLTRSRFPHLGV